MLSAAVVLTLAGATLATAARAPVEDGTLSIRDGRANITLKMRGGIIGRFGRGKLWVADSDTGSVVVRGAERSRDAAGNMTLYSGQNIRFRIDDERRTVVRIHAAKINLSAVGRGDGVLDGWGDPQSGVFFDGSYSLNGEDYRSLPDERMRFDLEAPPGA
jgi:hypothetical protein